MYRQLQIVPGREGFLVRNEDQDIALFKTHKDAELFINNIQGNDQMLPPHGIVPFEPVINPHMLANRYANPAYMGAHHINDCGPTKEKIEKEVITQPINVPQYIPSPTPQIFFIQQPPINPTYTQYPSSEPKKETTVERCECHSKRHSHGCDYFNYVDHHSDYYYPQPPRRSIINPMPYPSQSVSVPHNVPNMHPNYEPANIYQNPMHINPMSNNYASQQQFNSTPINNYGYQNQQVNENIVSNNLNPRRYPQNRAMQNMPSDYNYSVNQALHNYPTPNQENMYRTESSYPHQYEHNFSDYHRYNNGNIVDNAYVDKGTHNPPQQPMRDIPKTEPAKVSRPEQVHPPHKEVVKPPYEIKEEVIAKEAIKTETAPNPEPIEIKVDEVVTKVDAQIRNEELPSKKELEPKKEEAKKEELHVTPEPTNDKVTVKEVETPKAEEPKVETQKIEESKVTEPKVQTPKEMNKVDFSELETKKETVVPTESKPEVNETNIWINTELENTMQFDSINELEDALTVNDSILVDDDLYDEDDALLDEDNEFVLGNGFGGEESMNLDSILNSPANSYEQIMEKLNSGDIDRREKKILKKQLKQIKR